MLSLFCKPDSGGEPTFGKALDTWLSDERLRVKRSTYATYCGVTERHVRPALGDIPFYALTSESVAKFLEERGKCLAPATMRLVCRVVRGAMDKARRSGAKLPAGEVIAAPRLNRPEARIMTDADRAALEAQFRSHTDEPRLGLLICMYTGMRLGEICALRWEDFSRDGTTICIHRTLQRVSLPRGGEGPRTMMLFDAPKSQRSNRTIPVPASLSELTARHRRGDDCFVLTGRPDEFMEPRRLQARFKNELRSCGAEDINFHALRHTFATNCVKMGCDPTTLSRILGHSDVSVTLNIYVHPSLDSMRALMDRL